MMNFYYVVTPDGISIEHSWIKVKSMIHRVPNSHCQRFDNKPNLERWLEYVEKYCNENTVNIFKSMIEEENKNKPIIKEIEKPILGSSKGLRIVKKNTKK